MKIKHSIIGIEKLAHWAETRYGIQASELLKGSGIKKERLSDPHAVVDLAEELVFYRNLKRHLILSNLGFKAGFQLTASTYGIWGLAIQSCKTLLDGIHMGLRYIDFTYTFNHIYYQKGDRFGSIVVEPGEGLGELTDFMVQRDQAAIVRLIYDGLQPELPFYQIHLSQDYLDNKALYEKALGCEILLGKDNNAVLIHENELSRSLNQANPLTWKLCCEQLDLLHSQRLESMSLREQIEGYLLRQTQLCVKMEEVASKFGIAERSMRRKLSLEGTSYKEIVERVRQLLALEYLRSGELTLEQIAERLGYSDSVSFSHAYKRWFDCAPRSQSIALEAINN